MGDALARDAARRLSAEYERIRDVRHARGNHATRGTGLQAIDDLTEGGARRVLSGPELAGVLEDLRDTPQRAAAILLRRTDLLKVMGQLVRHQGPLWNARGAGWFDGRLFFAAHVVNQVLGRSVDLVVPLAHRVQSVDSAPAMHALDSAAFDGGLLSWVRPLCDAREQASRAAYFLGLERAAQERQHARDAARARAAGRTAGASAARAAGADDGAGARARARGAARADAHAAERDAARRAADARRGRAEAAAAAATARAAARRARARANARFFFFCIRVRVLLRRRRRDPQRVRSPALPCTAGAVDGDARTAIDRVPILECVAAGVDVRTSCDVPQQHAEHWAEVSGAILGWLNAALRGGDARQVATATRWFFARSAILLRTVRGGRRGRAQLAARFDAFKSGRYAWLVEDWRADVARSRARGVARTSNESATQEAVRLIRDLEPATSVIRRSARRPSASTLSDGATCGRNGATTSATGMRTHRG